MKVRYAFLWNVYQKDCILQYTVFVYVHVHLLPRQLQSTTVFPFPDDILKGTHK
jgi:hypothetical protein